MRLKITLLILGGLAWANALSAVYATGLWVRIFDNFINKFDLTYAQGILLIPGISITFCILTGIASVFWGKKVSELESYFLRRLRTWLVFSVYQLFYFMPLLMSIVHQPLHKWSQWFRLNEFVALFMKQGR